MSEERRQDVFLNTQGLNAHVSLNDQICIISVTSPLNQTQHKLVLPPLALYRGINVIAKVDSSNTEHTLHKLDPILNQTNLICSAFPTSMLEMCVLKSITC